MKTATDNGFPKRKCHCGRKHTHRPSQRVIQMRRRNRALHARHLLEAKRKHDALVSAYFRGELDLHP